VNENTAENGHREFQIVGVAKKKQEEPKYVQTWGTKMNARYEMECSLAPLILPSLQSR